MIRLLKIFSAAGFLLAGSGAHAAVTSFQPNPANLDNLDHHLAYTWEINNVDPSGEQITSATISFKGIANWDSAPNILYMHLFDSARNNGVASFQDRPNSQTDVPPSQWVDNFAPGSQYANNPNWLIAPGTGNTFLASPSFTTTPTNYTYTFTADQLKALNAYVANGDNIALGFDPDCHFFNNGVTFTITTCPVPEPSAIILLGGGIIGLFLRHRFQKRRAELLG